ncbi:uncharacterized protein BDR25DRAFT_340189 [Lindgomyces ingoldianus]|uniref:Uncharacterized protein n=1 Tax=Lindgomyces ingoldianus TaxID=673940 RepID=A0ACB6RA81_9PLEO|nr:uncharacterized protein BDR25DRAFT_340189 [Lindgomyces ingoldianus]KAF2475437.1 hypothetical protein BDR25DRAFT_340189 [Lindgomyces ingoldianus]
MDNLSITEQNQLKQLLERKLQGIPFGHVDITLEDIANLSLKALQLPNIPPDIQLDYFLRNRSTMLQHFDLPHKSITEQSLTLTRAIFFYRLSERHQFCRYHDPMRWNTLLFITLLTVSPSSFRTLSAKEFAISYLFAVLEHHNNPGRFDMRENFIRVWKSGKYEFWRFTASQAKVLKRESKRLHEDMERELDIARYQVGEAEYIDFVAGFVGSLVPGRKDQRVRCYPGGEEASEENGDDAFGIKEDEDEEEKMVHIADNYMLKALRVPIQEHDIGEPEECGPENRVAKIETSIDALKKVKARDILLELLNLFT